MKNYIWFLKKAATMMADYWEILFLIGIFIMAGILMVIAKKTRNWGEIIFWTLVLALFPFIYLQLGNLWEGLEQNADNASWWQAPMLPLLAAIQILLAVIAIKKTKYGPIALGGIVALILFFSYFCYTIAQMSMSGNWN